MSKAQLAKAPYSRGVKMPTKVKTCQFPGCEVSFEGIGASKYCEEHRKSMYRKVLNIVKDVEKNKDVSTSPKPERSNQIIVHDNSIATLHTCSCPCGNEFVITLFPSVDIYPRFCEEHRNPYKRDRLLRSLGEFDSFEVHPDIKIDEPDYEDMFKKAMNACGADMEEMGEYMEDFF